MKAIFGIIIQVIFHTQYVIGVYCFVGKISTGLLTHTPSAIPIPKAGALETVSK